MKKLFGVVSGLALAQVITLCASPFIARLYLPEDFAEVGMYLTVVAFITPIVCLSYPFAIVQSEDDEIGSLCKGCAKVSLWVIIGLLALAFFIESSGREILPVGINWWFIPILGVCVILQQLGVNLATREGGLQKIVYNRWIITGLTVSINLGLGYFFRESWVLLAGLLVGNFFGALYFFKDFLHSVKRGKKLGVFKKYKNFPIYTLPSSLLNCSAQNLPIICFGWLHGAYELGVLMFVQRLVNVPLRVISESLGAAYKSESADEFRASGNCRKTYKKFLLIYGLIAVAGFFIISLMVLIFFEITFGSKWVLGKSYIMALLPYVMIRLIASPLSYTLFLYNKQNWNLFGNIMLLLMGAAGVYVGHLNPDPIFSVLGFSLGSSLVYIGYIYYSFSLTKYKNKLA